jgi:hypothetical protein
MPARVRRVTLKALGLTLLLLASQTVNATSASAFGGTWTLNVWDPQVNANGNTFSKAQTKVLTGLPPDKLVVVVCVVVWDGSEYFQLSTCVKGSVNNKLQVTRNKTLAGGCNHNTPYGTKARGELHDDGVTYFAPPQLGSWVFRPTSGGKIIC